MTSYTSRRALKRWLSIVPLPGRLSTGTVGRASLDNPDLPASFVAEALASMREPRDLCLANGVHELRGSTDKAICPTVKKPTCQRCD
uniref:hypothetical protein n=1 Tax=Candidatus Nitrotoga sp. M5 TaxID=2890409 RepID=UPI001EF2169D|nr:hypothetical protein [Candidatus Nitrotoga sp. M5]